MARLAVKLILAAAVAALAVALLLILPRSRPAPEQSASPAPTSGALESSEPAAPRDAWKLVWQDEFDGGALDPKHWNIEETTPANPGLGPDDFTPAHVSVADGVLSMKALPKDDGRFLTALVNTRHKAAWQNGRFEARIKVPPGPGTNSAFWMMPNVEVFEPWPKSGEIDIAEQLGREPTITHGTIHFPGESLARDHGVYNRDESLTEKLSDDYHVYAVEWREGSFEWFLDGKSFHKTSQPSMAKFPFNRPFFIVLSLGVGDKWTGPVTAETPLPMVLRVDWVRVYQLDETQNPGSLRAN